MNGQSERSWMTDESLKSSLEGTTISLLGDSRISTGPPNSFPLDCSKVKSRNVVTYGWETRQYDGRLVDVHKDGKFIAYTLRGHQSLVRVFNRPHQTKGLIKGFSGQAIDISWAKISSPLTLACVDESGSLYVYRVIMGQSESDPFQLHRCLMLTRSGDEVPIPLGTQFRVFWCFYVPDSDCNTDESGEEMKDQNHSHTLTLIHANHVQIVNVETVMQCHGDQCHYESLTDGYSTRQESCDISAFTMSPDASAIAVANASGQVNFYLTDDLQRCNYKWVPHEGKTVDTILFLDNLKHHSQESQFWKFALTGCEGNRELKLWQCESWVCQQTLLIDSPPPTEGRQLNFQLTVDLSGQFIFLSDIYRKSLYLIELVGMGKGRLQFSFFTEFPLLQPALGMAVVDASRRRFRPFPPAIQPDESDWGKVDSDDEDADGTDNLKVVGVNALIEVVNPKSLVEMQIRYESSLGVDNVNSLDTFPSVEFDEPFDSDNLSDISRRSIEVPSAPHVLMSPDDFQAASDSAKRISPTSPAGSITPTHEYFGTHQPSASPSSQEVTSILSFSTANESQTPNVLPAVLSFPERPPTPITHTFDLMSVASSTQLNPTESVWPRGHSMIDGGATPDLGSNLMKLSMEVERLVSHMQRQEDKTQEMKTLLVAQNDRLIAQAEEINGLKVTLKAAAEQRQVTEDMAKKLMLLAGNLQAFRPETIKTGCEHAVREAAEKSLKGGLKDEMRNFMKPWMKELKEQLMLELAQKLTVADNMLRDTLLKMVKSNQVMEVLGPMAGEIVSKELGAAVKEAIATQFIPAMDGCAKSLFNQLNSTYEKGTKEYLDQMNSHLAETQKSLMRGWDEQISVALSSHMQKLQESLRSMVHEEVSVVVREQQGELEKSFSRALRSNAPTPVLKPNVMEIHQQLDRQLQAGKINDAFHTALCTQDVANVLYVCAKIPPQQLFGKVPCPLLQPVILSLIQQLSADLNGQTELKLGYISEATTVLEKDDPTISQHIGAIMKAMKSSIGAFLIANPNTQHQRTLKTLSLMAQGLIG